jgi:hypothetical protein
MMFKRIAVALDESAGAFHAHASAISLSKILSADLRTVAREAPVEHCLCPCLEAVR